MAVPEKNADGLRLGVAETDADVDAHIEGWYGRSFEFVSSSI
jgi:hypothetical protein